MPNKIKAAIALFFISVSLAYSGNTVTGKIESIRENGYITVIFDSPAEKDRYYIKSDETVIGDIISLKKIEGVYGKSRYLCRYTLVRENYLNILRPGLDITVIESDKEIDKRLQKNPYIDTYEYKREIRSVIDGREMVLIPSGKFQMGCSVCGDDEYPEHTEYLDDYYIDKYEVSNSEYKHYADIKGVRYPDYWKDQINENGDFISPFFGSLPVIVTYNEGAGYARWSGKRLPTENEWEKAARKPVADDRHSGGGLYSWGRGFKQGIANTEELWFSEKTGENVKKLTAEKYSLATVSKGYLPVDIFDSESLSFYGAVNLDGNALEWTDSWYRAYPGNRKSNKKYGDQYKVVRGGAYYLPAGDARITDRKIGGIPDLYRDRLAGFRCVRKPVESDRKR